MLFLEWNKKNNFMIANLDGKVSHISVSCLVRNEINNWRPNPKKKPADEVVYAITKNNTQSNVPVMPRQFPNGRWRIISVEERTDKYRAPYILLTNAWQQLEEWKLDENGGYNKPTGDVIDDYFYGLHYSKSNTTTGCIKIMNKEDLLWLVDTANKDLKKYIYPIIEVTG